MQGKLRTIVRFDASVQVSWRTWQSRAGGTWIASCDPLKITARGETWGELQESMAELISELFRDLFESGDLAVFLNEKGWRPVTP